MLVASHWIGNILCSLISVEYFLLVFQIDTKVQLVISSMHHYYYMITQLKWEGNKCTRQQNSRKLSFSVGQPWIDNYYGSPRKIGNGEWICSEKMLGKKKWWRVGHIFYPYRLWVVCRLFFYFSGNWHPPLSGSSKRIEFMTDPITSYFQTLVGLPCKLSNHGSLMEKHSSLEFCWENGWNRAVK